MKAKYMYHAEIELEYDMDPEDIKDLKSPDELFQGIRELICDEVANVGAGSVTMMDGRVEIN